MSLSFANLASGSSGNCSILRSPSGAMLIDCGIGPRVTAARLKSLDANLSEISAICLTHTDRDHFNVNWVRELLKRGIAVYCHRSHCHGLPELAGQIRPFGSDRFSPLPDLAVEPIHLPHDELGSFGFVIEYHGARIGYATDLGRVDDKLIRHFTDLQLLAIESNYDPIMEENSSRPFFLKRRIMGGSGHLSNPQAFEAVRKILDRCRQTRAALPRHIVLLHRSRECNCPHRLSNLFKQDHRIAPRLVLAEQNCATQWMWTHDSPALTLFDMRPINSAILA
jgi:phosphoribosyl 1,2-cyclic phosphodiesterase